MFINDTKNVFFPQCSETCPTRAGVPAPRCRDHCTGTQRANQRPHSLFVFPCTTESFLDKEKLKYLVASGHLVIVNRDHIALSPLSLFFGKRRKDSDIFSAVILVARTRLL